MGAADEMKRVRAEYGFGLGELKSAMEKCGTDDVLLAAGYLRFSGFAVSISGDRHEWNMQRAKAWRDEQIARKGEAHSIGP